MTQKRKKRRISRSRRRRILQIRMQIAAVAAAAAVLIVLGVRSRMAAGSGGETAEAGSGTQAALPEAAADHGVSEDVLHPEKEPAPEQKSGVQVTIGMVGDIILHDAVCEGAYENGAYDFSGLFANISGEVRDLDLAIANQETILGGEELGITGYPEFNGPFQQADALAAAGFDVVLQATNHTLDAGAAGVDNNLRYWKEHYPQMAVLGIHESGASARDIYVYEKEGFRIAVLNYTYGTNINQELLDAPETACLVDVLDEAVVTEDIRRAGELADYIIVCPHWGTENSYEISEDQRYWTQLFLDNGVDLVLGAHTHVIQPVETLREESGKEMLVYYSLGNCISNQEHADHMVGGMARLTLRKDGDEVYVDEYGVRPLVTQETPEGKYTVYFLDQYTEELAAENGIHNTDEGFSLDYCRELCQDVFGADRILY